MKTRLRITVCIRYCMVNTAAPRDRGAAAPEGAAVAAGARQPSLCALSLHATICLTTPTYLTCRRRIVQQCLSFVKQQIHHLRSKLLN